MELNCETQMFIERLQCCIGALDRLQKQGYAVQSIDINRAMPKITLEASHKEIDLPGFIIVCNGNAYGRRYSRKCCQINACLITWTEYQQ